MLLQPVVHFVSADLSNDPAEGAVLGLMELGQLQFVAGEGCCKEHVVECCRRNFLPDLRVVDLQAKAAARAAQCLAAFHKRIVFERCLGKDENGLMRCDAGEKILVIQPFRLDREDQGEQVGKRSGFGSGEPVGNVSGRHASDG